MVKRISFVRLRSDAPRETCLTSWFGPHADVVRGLPEVREYVVDLLPPTVAGEVGWDAIAVLRFEDRHAMSRCLDDPQTRAALLETRTTFADEVCVAVVDERVIVAGQSER